MRKIGNGVSRELHTEMEGVCPFLLNGFNRVKKPFTTRGGGGSGLDSVSSLVACPAMFVAKMVGSIRCDAHSWSW